MYLEPTTINEIIDCIGSLNVNKTVGHDIIPAYFSKIAAPILASYQVFFLISSLLMESFPSFVKLPKLFPFISRKKRITQTISDLYQF